MRQGKFNIIVLLGVCAPVILSVMGIFTGCNKDTATSPSSTNPNVNLAVSFSTSRGVGLMKFAGMLGADSIRIDSAVVVFSRIKFESHIDSVVVDNTGDDHDSAESDQNFVFRGPFVVHVQDTVGITFANQVLPAGTYDGIKFKIHRLLAGEHHEDCDKHRRLFDANDSSVAGSSIAVWGAIYKNGAWTNFTFNVDGEIELRMRGNFTVPDATSTVNIALNFNMGSWFTSPLDGTILDPSDTSFANQELIRQAIYAAFMHGTGGHDRGDGHPDD